MEVTEIFLPLSYAFQGELIAQAKKYLCLRVLFDETKRLSNIRNHGFDFIGCESVFAGFTITREDGRDAYGELRLQTLGLWGDVVVFIVHTPREELDHIISIRKAEKHEERIYWKNHPN